MDQCAATISVRNEAVNGENCTLVVLRRLCDDFGSLILGFSARCDNQRTTLECLEAAICTAERE